MGGRQGNHRHFEPAFHRQARPVLCRHAYLRLPDPLLLLSIPPLAAFTLPVDKSSILTKPIICRHHTCLDQLYLIEHYYNATETSGCLPDSVQRLGYTSLFPGSLPPGVPVPAATALQSRDLRKCRWMLGYVPLLHVVNADC